MADQNADGAVDAERGSRRTVEDRRNTQERRQVLDITVDKTIDARGAYCPKPLMELILAMKTEPVGAIIETLSSLRQSTKEIPYWAAKLGHEFIGTEEKDGYWSILVKKTH